MSARAAWRLETLGFTRVFRYSPGLGGWLATGLPSEGTDASTPRAGDVADRGVPTCALHDRLGDVRERLRAAGETSCIVVNDQRVVLGRVRGKALDGDGEQPVEAVMEAGPTTVRPSEPLAALIERMQKRRAGSIVVSMPDGVLVGVLRREDGERRLAER
ncbi:MAG: CBS domain-containing protein [Thermomicrobiales bacterium]